MLTLPTEKIATWSKYPDPILTSLHICWNNFIENYYFLGQQGEDMVLFLLFFTSKNLQIITHKESQTRQKKQWTDSTWAQQLPINDTYTGSGYMTWQAEMFR